MATRRGVDNGAAEEISRGCTGMAITGQKFLLNHHKSNGSPRCSLVQDQHAFLHFRHHRFIARRSSANHCDCHTDLRLLPRRIRDRGRPSLVGLPQSKMVSVTTIGD
ncbi:hypothetical protein PIB30_017919 [Stylosanthes scabra]|uniref:Uncharacterized protein n=1 Tax=Stylosanthes scabra TaxID=79078 RepID=A0ABU6Q993_9FABA|nr:hypothetical protein [Stylosanthes scabra]